MAITLRELTSFDIIYQEQTYEVVGMAITLAYSMAENDPSIHSKLYEYDVGTEEWEIEVTNETLSMLPSADEYWERCQEFIKLNSEDGDVERLMQALGKIGPVLLSLRSFLEGEVFDDLNLSVKGLIQ